MDMVNINYLNLVLVLLSSGKKNLHLLRFLFTFYIDKYRLMFDLFKLRTSPKFMNNVNGYFYSTDLSSCGCLWKQNRGNVNLGSDGLPLLTVCFNLTNGSKIDSEETPAALCVILRCLPKIKQEDVQRSCSDALRKSKT